ncbi:MAG: NAD(P)H-dependent oxidoreductase subunit E [Acidimicrobiia bacterium]|nr:MAG: NAD(P)H-dependent oxidoreductase subunit E [Acidimicrobiia bacterium]
MDLRHLIAQATESERAAVDRLLQAEGFPDLTGTPGRTAVGGRTAAARRDLLLPALHALNDAVGWISEGGLGYLCEALSVPPAEAYGVAAFYDQFTFEERAEVVRVCDDIVCGPYADQLIAGLDGIEVERVPCLGRCEKAPAVFIQQPGFRRTEIAPATPKAVLDGEPTSVDTHIGVIGEPILLARVGTVDPESLDAYRTAGGYQALSRATDDGAGTVLDRIEAARLRGRGGASFPAAAKWRAVAGGQGHKIVVCNADESEPGTFKDRVLMEGDPFAVVEGMTLAAYVTGAERGFLYIRGEYPLAERRMVGAIEAARSAGLLGGDVAGAGFAFDVEVRRGAGAYICGEETSLFNSIEGLRGEPRAKPPFPTQEGLFGLPTVVNNVETLVAAVAITMDKDGGSKLFPMSGAIARPGLYEAPLGVSVAALIDAAGGPTTDIQAVLVGGAAGTFLLPKDLDVTLDHGTEPPLGSGAIVVFDTATDMVAIVDRIARFFRDESCGKCVPCRVGTIRQVEALERLGNGSVERETLDDLAAVLRDASICGLGQLAAEAVQSALDLELIGVRRD